MTSGYLERPAPSGLADVIETILDKGIVIDAYVRVSVVGIELLTIDARIVIASVDTYLRFAEATNRLDLEEKGGRDLTEVIEDLGGPVVEKAASKVAQSKVEDVVEGTVGGKGAAKVAEAAGKAAKAGGSAARGVAESVGKAVDTVSDAVGDGDDEESADTDDTAVDKAVELVTDLATSTVDRALDAAEKVVGRAKNLLP
jgi:hypothetical protein